MARTPAEAFDLFLSWLTPTDTESAAAQAHRQSIQDCIAANFGLITFFRTGSFGNGTSVSGFSDVDYFAVIPRSRLAQNSHEVLRQLSLFLDRRFPDTGVAPDPPAIRVPFAAGTEATEVVPADYLGETVSGDRIFDIPNAAGGWIRSSPEAHHGFIRKLDDSKGGRVRALIRLVKAWKYFNALPISSFFIELQVAAYSATRSALSFEHDLAHTLRHLKASGLRAAADPTGVSEPVQAVSSTADLIVSSRALERAVNVAPIARAFLALQQPTKALGAWATLFAGKFPTG